MANYSGRGHARREELAREKGFASYGQYRKASKGEREKASKALAKRSPTYQKTGGARQAAAPRKRRRVDLGDGREIVQTKSLREIVAFCKRAANNAERVYGTVTVRIPSGADREVTLWSRGGIDPDTLRLDVESEGVLNYFARQIDIVGLYGTPEDFVIRIIELRAGIQ